MSAGLRSGPLRRAPAADRIRRALSGRLHAAADILAPAGSPWADAAAAAGADPGAQLQALVEAVRADPADDRVWLLLTAVAGCFPTRDEVDRTRREFELADEVDLCFLLLDHALAQSGSVGMPEAGIRIVSQDVLVDVDHTATQDLHTGIQRVVREMVPLLAAAHRPTLVRWTDARGALTELTRQERRRVLDWAEMEKSLGRDGSAGLEQDVGDLFETPGQTLLVPWRSVLLLAEVPPVDAADRLAAVGDKSGNRLVGVFYDAIPVVSADMVPPEDTTKFVRYLTAVKFAARMAGLSDGSAAEIRGFARALATQGLAGPLVATVIPATPTPESDAFDPPTGAITPRDGHPVTGTGTGTVAGRGPGATSASVVVLGSHEPRKNHLAVLHAAELLWREGLDFALDFIGGSGWGTEFPDRVAALIAAGRPVTVRRAVSEATLHRALTEARFTVFPSLHEGFGLPVAESLTVGTPVITADFGPPAEIARPGGCLLVDPRDDRALTAAMRTLLTDPSEVARLAAEIAGRPARSWADYADDLWAFLVEPELAQLAGTGGNP